MNEYKPSVNVISYDDKSGTFRRKAGKTYRLSGVQIIADCSYSLQIIITGSNLYSCALNFPNCISVTSSLQ